MLGKVVLTDWPPCRERAWASGPGELLASHFPALKCLMYCSQSFLNIVSGTSKASFEIFYHHSGHLLSKKRSLNWESCKEGLQE